MVREFEKNSFVKYGTSGVCCVYDIGDAGFSNGKTYYILKPVANPASTVYVPSDNEKLMLKMKPVLTQVEIDDLIDKCSQTAAPWISDKYERKDKFISVISESDRFELLMLIKCLILHRQDIAAHGKRLSSTDESFLRQAESLIDDEFSYALELSISKTETYIRQRLNLASKIVEPEDADTED